MKQSDKLSTFASLAEKSAVSGTLKNIVFSNADSGEVLKIKGQIKQLQSGTVVRFESSLTEGRVKQENVSLDTLASYITERATPFRECYLNDSSASVSLLESKKGKVSLLTKGNVGDGLKIEPKEDKKQYFLTGDEHFLIDIGISDKNGRIHDKKQSKFRQINRFLEHIEDMSRYLPKSGTLRIADLCCGKSYLSFAVYYYFTVIQGRSVEMDCVDLKESVMEYCAGVAEKSNFSGMHFTAGDVTKYSVKESPHLVISLHACDVATDIVLDKAASLGASVILATPCCHRQLSRELDCEELGFISANSVLKSKFCDAATDSLRVMRLSALGYNTDAVEMIDPDETPKNVLIRAHKSNKISYKNTDNIKFEKYKAAYNFLCKKDPPPLPEIVF